MGQICVAKAFRGQGVFDGLYAKMRTICAGEFDFTITEVAARNTRSMRAHERVGFKTLHQYDDTSSGETWRLILLEF
jgi:RimJ/RimL family protein N-acetyltransferase